MNVGRIAPVPAGAPGPRPASPAAETAFDRFLDGISPPADVEADPQATVAFSRHASARLQSRGIELSAEDLSEISSAIDRLSESKARESLVLIGENAFVVGVPRRTVITAMTRGEAVGSIFTHIDSTLVVR